MREKTRNKKHRFKIEELFELRGLKYISTPRKGLRRGGGAAIIVDDSSYTVSKLNVSILRRLEIVWGLIQPKEQTGKVNKIIVCSFYCPPSSKKKTALVEHMMLTLQLLRSEHTNAGVIIAGDRNDLKIEKLMNIDTSLKQIVKSPTRGPNLLDVILTDLHKFYQVPEIVMPIDVDYPGNGVPSDHSGVVATPLRSCNDVPVSHQKITKVIQPIPQYAMNNIGQALCSEEWTFMNPDLSATQLTSL